MSALLALALLCGAAHAADERAADFASAARIETSSAASHFRVQLATPVYRAAAQRGLGDLRVANAEGEFVPFAFAPRVAQQAAPPETRPAKLFPLHGDEARPVDGLSLRVERSAAGTVVKLDAGEAPRSGRKVLLGYIAELPELSRPLQALVFDWQADSGFTGGVRIEASDDLKQWRTLSARAPLIQLEHAGERLERKRVELFEARPKFLRLSFHGVPPGFALRAVTCELRSERPEPERHVLTVGGAQDAERKNEYRFDTGGAFPVERLRFELPQGNTIAPVQVLARERNEDQWRPVASATVYRLSREDGEILSPSIEVASVTDRQWLLRVDARSGGLGAGEVKLVVSWQPHEIVFAARGAAPFSLFVGSKNAAAVALPLATILPGYREGEPLAAVSARLGAIGANAAAPRGAQDPVATVREFAGSAEGKKWLLWSVLVAGVLFLVWMATRLMRELGGSHKPPGKQE